MTTETKPLAGRRILASPPRRQPRRSDEPYSSILEEDVGLTTELGAQSRRVRAARITREEVFTTADALLLEGIRPTIERVRVRLGRGSPNTINEFMDAWWTKLGSRLRDLPGREFPELPDSVALSLQKLWNEALDVAHQVLEATFVRRGVEVTANERTLEADQLARESKRRARTTGNAALEEALEPARGQLEQGNQRARVLEHALEQRDAALNHARSELDQLTRELATLRSHQEVERGEALEERARIGERFESNEDRWLTELDRVRQGLKSAEAAAGELRAKMSKLAEDWESARNQLQQVRCELATATAVREQLEARIQAAMTQGARTSASKRPVTKPQKPVLRKRL